MKPKIIAWNVRGLNAFKKRLRIRGLFFFLINQNVLIKRKRCATHSTQDVYNGKPKEKKIGEK
jgi:hypothetical protein